MRRELSEVKRSEIYGRWDAGQKQNEIAAQKSINQSTVHRTTKRKLEDNSHSSHPRSGRPSKVTEPAKRKILGQIDDNPNLPWQYYGRNVDEHQNNVSGQTVKRVAEKEGLHKRIKRKKSWLLPIGWTIRRAHKEYTSKHMHIHFHSNHISVPIWGAIAYNKKFPLFRIPLERIKRPKGWKTYVAEVQEEQGGGVCMMVDGSPAHRAQITRDAEAALSLQQFPHPPYSPDLNPIKSMWADVKHELDHGRPQPTNADKLFQEIQRIWDGIPITRVNQLIESMSARRDELEKADGLQTSF
ncbi:hypothetical protein TREMEDRAFT_70078 [Tremella mesenterica DSM 1558]|uniref:uncharacterized protein n=1 Tax=Tremella mesenterica (strain ATCC 24925 / CBS 8224 / DSM 1558 / NBRC 9311 / NRRL Y-6157 / RJB 2259-6 / UBC 559-6) TaxID=578456 RepID=UPI00032C0B89|nr:uncharacterized protein TREMEDRAFT_70078 [Tremella mesenterica DSM 1558]EIW66465.1 hypothetical protein TREMEDRAFT_70078 [Tremella mesenterica DSM 1558]